ncbi:hypothetical protein U1E44_11165 [Arenibacter sp. GZD96]|uniref:tetratricopeptide repeat protein n=1 Tax=Aurantibrevibacter litoralis TaxID=3106030 RepID=UPI002B0003A3|nr:hypothetical protein [Arenibacter sp. GZD-96]MEA1786654.1 hypothetical protein [Arenibacter sp. GZD-96]
MNHVVFVRFLYLSIVFFTPFLRGQEQLMEQASAEVFLEEYNDVFQDKFFEALKQKGIENHDRAIHLLLECKAIDGTNRVLDHELAKAYAQNKQYAAAEDYAVKTLLSEPENMWYLNTLVEIMQKQGKPLESIQKDIPFTNAQLQENLALIYYRQQNFENALLILKGIKKSSFTEELQAKVTHALAETDASSEKKKPRSAELTDNPVDAYKTRLQTLIRNGDFSTLQKASQEALETFPVQPFFYYANGLALNKAAKPEEAIAMLETALGYWVEDNMLLETIYSELIIAYEAIGNTVKANAYRTKLKSGS